MRRRSTTLLYAIVGVALGVVAFLRGDYLLGADIGVYYAVIALGLFCLFVRSRTSGRAVALAVLSLVAGFVMAWPAAINSDLRYFIDDHALDRTARAELAAVFGSDRAYHDLSVSPMRLKAVVVTVEGPLGTRLDFDRLRSRIAEECPALGKCSLCWDVILQDSGQRVKGSNRDLVVRTEPGE